MEQQTPTDGWLARYVITLVTSIRRKVPENISLAESMEFS